MEREGWDEADEVVERLVRNPAGAPLGPADRALVDYALKLTVGPHRITAADLEPVRTAGFDDRAIHDLCCIVAYYAFVNRVADGLGVELEGVDR